MSQRFAPLNVNLARNSFAGSGTLNSKKIEVKFANHVFISYARIDNETTEDDEPGWVDRFHRSLKAFLSTAIGEEPVIWRDPQLRGNEALAEGIEQQLPNTALLVSILSPRYLVSEWCLREIEEFCKIAELHGGLVIDNKMRIFRVMLMPICGRSPREAARRVKEYSRLSIL